MGYLRCKQCGRVIHSPNYVKVGLKCGHNNCQGLLEIKGGYFVASSPNAKLDLRCRKCYHICSSAATGLKVYSKCPMKGCNGTLDRFYG